MAKLTLPYPYFQPDRYAEVSRNRIPLPAENTPPLALLLAGIHTYLPR